MVPLLGILLYSGFFSTNVFGINTEPNAQWINPAISNEQILNNSGSTLIFNGNVVTSTEESTSISQSALWFPKGKIQNSFNTSYWTFTIREMETSTRSKILVGISDLKKISPEWSMSGLFYDEYLSDGAVALTLGSDKFGPNLVAGDKLSMLIKFDETRIKVYFILNYRLLGLAFDVPGNTLEGVYPVVKFTGKGSVEIKESGSLAAPTQLELFSIEGSWNLHTLGNESIVGLIMQIRGTGGPRIHRSYRIHIYALNTLIGKLTQTLAERNGKLVWFGKIRAETTLKGTPDEMGMETRISKHISEMNSLVHNIEQNELRIESMDTISFWKQIEPRSSFVDWNPFNKPWPWN